MGRNRIPATKDKLRGNPGKRAPKTEHEVDAPPLRCPPGLSKADKRYWRTWAPDLIAIGKLNIMTLPAFITLVKMKVRLDTVNAFLDKENASLLQANVFVDGAGKEHQIYKESAYAKMSRDLTQIVNRLMKPWGLTADGMAGLFKTKKKSAEEEFLG